MNPIEYRDPENRFEDACKFAAALVAVGLIVFAGESAMRHLPDVPLTVPVHLAPVDPLEPAAHTVDAPAPEPY